MASITVWAPAVLKENLVLPFFKYLLKEDMKVVALM
jgi:hypothetical protein